VNPPRRRLLGRGHCEHGAVQVGEHAHVLEDGAGGRGEGAWPSAKPGRPGPRTAKEGGMFGRPPEEES
jgi:hypothetical protein